MWSVSASGKISVVALVTVLLLLIPTNVSAERNKKKRYKRYSKQGYHLKAKRRKRKSATGLFGKIELKPTFHTIEETFNTQNSVELGLKLSSNSQISYVQEINTRIAEDAIEGENSIGLDPYIADGFLKAKLDNLWKRKKVGAAFGYETRVFFPTHEAKRDAGMIFVWRNYFKLERALSPTVTWKLAEVPILHVYSEEANFEVDGPLKANPIFENRIEFAFSFVLGKQVTLKLPLNFHLTKYREVDAEAEMNGELDYFLNLAPELTFTVNENVSLGVSYQTDNLIGKHLERQDGVTTSNDIDSGVIQLILGLSI